jgi:hypothetical protein
MFGGRENTLTIGAFPEVGLDLARKRRRDAKKPSISKSAIWTRLVGRN